MAQSPYTELPPAAFWKSAVAERSPAETGLYRKRFEIASETRIATAGSCFAQHIGQRLRQNGYRVVDGEPPPPYLREETARRYGYGLFSARTGNIYTIRQLLQLAREAQGLFEPVDAIWSAGSRFYDALRPNVEPGGLESAALVRRHREAHLRRVRALLAATDLFVFTFGLTEAWTHGASGTVYPTAPGTIAGSYDPAIHAFRNFTVAETHADFLAFRTLLRDHNPAVRFLLTVSPVPLTATASGRHVLQATIHSKSVLRAVAGQLADEFEDVDYFPSYEIIGTPFLWQRYFEPNLRSVTAEGVDAVMRVFFAEHGVHPLAAPAPELAVPDKAADAVCEDVLLEALAR